MIKKKNLVIKFQYNSNRKTKQTNQKPTDFHNPLNLHSSSTTQYQATTKDPKLIPQIRGTHKRQLPHQEATQQTAPNQTSISTEAHLRIPTPLVIKTRRDL